jgi:hypothetical protein
VLFPRADEYHAARLRALAAAPRLPEAPEQRAA